MSENTELGGTFESTSWDARVRDLVTQAQRGLTTDALVARARLQDLIELLEAVPDPSRQFAIDQATRAIGVLRGREALPPHELALLVVEAKASALHAIAASAVPGGTP
jgi:hypothetical protein